MKSPSQAAILDLSAVLRAIRERWFVAFLLAITVCAPAGYWLLTQPPEYEAKARVRVDRSAEQVLEFREVVDQTIDGQAIDSVVFTVVQELQSHNLYFRVARDLPASERAEILAAYRDGDEPTPALAEGENALVAEVVRLIANKTTVERDGRTLLVGVTVLHRVPRLAKLLADRIAETYVAQTVERTGVSGTTAARFVDEQVTKSKVEMDEAVRALQDYREKHSLVMLAGGQNLLATRLTVLNQSIAETRVERLNLESKLALARKVGADQISAKALASMPEFSTFIKLEAEADALRLERMALSERFGAKHPRMIENAAAIATFVAQQTANLTAAFSDLEQQLSRLRAQETELARTITEVENDALKIDRAIATDESLARTAKTRQDLYSQLLERQIQTKISGQLPTTNIRISDTAALPETPAKPQKLKIIAVLIMLGCSIFVGFPLAAALLDRRVTQWDPSDESSGPPLVGEIIRVSGVRKRDRARVVQTRSDEATVEAFRCLHSQLLIRSHAAGPKVMLVTSATPAEGKTFVASNLAACFAAHGTRTLLIDCDFRRPRLHVVLGGIRNDSGILPYLRGNGPVPPDVRRDGTLGILEIGNNLHLLRSGGEAREAPEILQGPRLAPLFEALQLHYDMIVVDTPPAGVFPDTDCLARVSDDLLFVCRYKATNRDHVAAVLDRLKCTDLAMSGIVLNAVPRGRSTAENQSGFGYSASYRYSNYYKTTRG